MIALLLDHLWQSTLFAAAAGLLTLAFVRNSAAVRYWIWFAASIKFLIPFSVLTALGAFLFRSFAPAILSPVFVDFESAAIPFSGSAPVLTSSIGSSIDWPLILLAIWVPGFITILALWTMRWAKLRDALAGATPLAIAAPLPVKSSIALLEPGLVGIWQPILLLPQGIAARLTQPEADAILLHELCHLRRRDNLLASVHMGVEALFWFYPLIWWLGTRLIAERENACDEAVLASGSDPQTYAQGILKVCQFYLHSPLACASGISGADLKKRMEMIMENKRILRLNHSKRGLLSACAIATIAMPLALGLLTTSPAVLPAMALSVNAPHTGTEAALRRQIEGFERNQPVVEDLTPALVTILKQQQPQIQKTIDGWGALKSISFKGSERGLDEYLVIFEHGVSLWSLSPLNSDGKITSLGFASAEIRTDTTKPSPGTEAALRRNIEGLRENQPAYDIMVPGLVTATKQQLPALEATQKSLGMLKSLTFQFVNPRGWDVYVATHEHGTATWTVQPLADGKIEGILIGNVLLPSAPPHPGTEASLRRYIVSLEKGQPNYEEMTPTMSAVVKQQLPGVLATIKSNGALKSIVFKGGGPQNMDMYEVTFEHGKAEWNIAPLDANGKVVLRGFRVLP